MMKLTGHPNWVSYSELNAHWQRVRSRYKIKETRLEKELADATARLEQHRRKHPTWIERIVEPIAMRLALVLGREPEILGPFGICSHVSIHLKVPSGNGETVRSITFTSQYDADDEIVLCWRDWSRDTGKYPRGTMGEINGMNHPSEPIPDAADLDWFIARLSGD